MFKLFSVVNDKLTTDPNFHAPQVFRGYICKALHNSVGQKGLFETCYPGDHLSNASKTSAANVLTFGLCDTPVWVESWSHHELQIKPDFVAAFESCSSVQDENIWIYLVPSSCLLSWVNSPETSWNSHGGRRSPDTKQRLRGSQQIWHLWIVRNCTAESGSMFPFAFAMLKNLHTELWGADALRRKKTCAVGRGVVVKISGFSQCSQKLIDSAFPPIAWSLKNPWGLGTIATQYSYLEFGVYMSFIKSFPQIRHHSCFMLWYRYSTWHWKASMFGFQGEHERCVQREN